MLTQARRRATSRDRTRAFTLVELLVVIAIIAVLISLSAVGLGSSLQSQRLTASANRLAGELSAAALQAIRYNKDIQVRLVRQKSEIDQKNQLRGIQLYSVDPKTGITTAAGEVIALDAGVVIFEDERASTLLTHQNTDAPDGYYTLRTNGSTDLPRDALDRWCLTMVLGNDVEGRTALPANYRTLVINPHTSAVRVY